MNPFAEAARQAALQSQTADVVSLNNLFGVMHALKIISAMLLIFAIAYLLSSRMRRVVNAIVCAPTKMVSRMLDLIMARLTPALITKWLTFSPERVQAMLKKACADHANPLIRGDIEQAREDQFPHEKYGFAWEYAPADVRRSVVWDGRLPDGSAVTNLAYRKLNIQIVADYAQNATRRAYRISLVMALGLTAVSVLFAAFQDWQQAALDFQVMAGSGAVKHTAYVADMAVNGTMQFITSALFAVVAAAAAFPALAYFGFWHQMKNWMRAASATLALPTRDTLVGWLQNADARASERESYLRHIQMAKKTTAIEIGKASGIAQARGATRAPAIGSTVGVDTISVRQHVVAFGGTGEGKTESFLKPVTRRVLDTFASEGKPLGLYVTDGKGVLWKDIVEMPEVAARSDVKIMGADDNQFGVNLINGMTPLEVSTVLSTVSTQILGQRGDVFWTEQASIQFMHAAVIAEALCIFERNHLLALDTATWDAFVPWSLMGVHFLATSPDALTNAIDQIAEALTKAAAELEDDSCVVEAEVVDLINTPTLAITINYLQKVWAVMPNETRGGIIANINTVLGKLAGAPRLMARFGTGKLTEGQTCDVDHALNGGVVGIATGEAQDGLVGQVIAAWLKTRLYIAARKRQALNPDAAKTVSCMLLADEFQMLATTGGSSSDAEFFNIARSTGVFMIAATQSLRSLEKRLGEVQTADLLNNLRTKVMLRCEEQKTLEFFRKAAGTTWRGVISEGDYYETQAQREMLRPEQPVDHNDYAITGVPTAFNMPAIWQHLKSFLPTLPILEAERRRRLISLDNRFIVSPKAAPSHDLRGGSDWGRYAQSRYDAHRASVQAATWRQEDKERSLKTENYKSQELFSAEELQLGQGHALVLAQRAGKTNVDIVDLA